MEGYVWEEDAQSGVYVNVCVKDFYVQKRDKTKYRRVLLIQEKLYLDER
jgi:hypothetical protein